MYLDDKEDDFMLDIFVNNLQQNSSIIIEDMDFQVDSLVTYMKIKKKISESTEV